MYSADRLTSSETTKLAEDIGKEAILRMTTAFYAKFKEDYHISKFLRNHDDPHEERLANWILEKMGLGSPWSNELYWRPDEEVQLAGGKSIAILDRTSAHVAAWYSPKRKPSEVGRRFKLDDCRIWMRLMFWAAEEEGLFQNEKFKKWYIQFIAHFVAVYEYTAPPFAEESAAWCLDPRNIEIYKESGRKMEDVINIDYATAKHRAKEAGYSLIL